MQSDPRQVRAMLGTSPSMLTLALLTNSPNPRSSGDPCGKIPYDTQQLNTVAYASQCPIASRSGKILGNDKIKHGGSSCEHRGIQK